MISENSLLVAQITDTHLFANFESEMREVCTARTLEAVIDRLEELQPQPDILLLTGDLSQDETSESYRRLASLLNRLAIPSYWLPGNHDNLPVMEKVLNEAPISPAKSFKLGEWGFLLLHTNVPGCVYGQLTSESLEWLEAQLQQMGDRSIVIALHHPPVPTGSKWMDEILLHNPEEFFAVIDRYPQVKIVVCGHIHQELDKKRGGVRYLGTPSTCIQFESGNPLLSIDKKTPGFRLLNLYADGSHSTKVQWVASEMRGMGNGK